MKSTIIILDLSRSADSAAAETSLTVEQMKRVRGGRSVVVRVDGGSLGTVNDFDINNAIFEGRIKGSYL